MLAGMSIIIMYYDRYLLKISWLNIEALEWIFGIQGGQNRHFWLSFDYFVPRDHRGHIIRSKDTQLYQSP